MRLDELTAGTAVAAGDLDAVADVEIAGLAYDSRAVRGGELFFCVSGFKRDGHEFAPQAVAQGAAALVVERPLGLGVPEVLVRSVRAAMAPIAARFYGDPTARAARRRRDGDERQDDDGVPRARAARGGRRAVRAARDGDVGRRRRAAAGRAHDAGGDRPAGGRSARCSTAAISACAIEVSSHALELGRADAVRFAAAVFTNLTQDHLDFHETMEDYFLAKRRLFVEHAPGVSVVNVDDSYGRRLAAEIDGVRTFAVDAPAQITARASCAATSRAARSRCTRRA